MIRVLVLGYGPMGLALSRAVLSCPNLAKLIAVFPWSQKDRERYEKHEISERYFKLFLKQNNIPIISAPSVNHYNFTEILTSLKPDLVFVGSWGEIFKPHVLTMPGIYFINCHPSYLPFHRGPNPYISVILSGEAESGVTFHIMNEEVDAGPIVMQSKLKLTRHETGESLRERCAHLAETMVPEILEGVVKGELETQPQPLEGSYIKINPDIAWINWNDSPEKIERQIHALYPWFDNLTCLGRYKVGFPWGSIVELSDKNNFEVSPGKIIQRQKKGILVSTIDPSKAILLKSPRFFQFPALFSPILGRYLLKPGASFHFSLK